MHTAFQQPEVELVQHWLVFSATLLLILYCSALIAPNYLETDSGFSAWILFPFRQLGCVSSALKVSFFHFPFLHIIDHYLTANLIFLRKADHNHNADHHHPRLSAMAKWYPNNHHHNHYCNYKIESSNPTIHFENKHLRHLWTGIVRIGHGGAFRYEGARPALLLVLPWHDNHHWHCPQHLPKNDEDDIHHHNHPPPHTWYLSLFLHSHILSPGNFTLGERINLRQICPATKQRKSPPQT